MLLVHVNVNFIVKCYYFLFSSDFFTCCLFMFDVSLSEQV